jgi:hypothetical protein
MTRYLVPLILVFSVQPAFSQGTSGIGFTLGWSDEAKFSPTIHYFHPLPISQFYAVGGYSYSNAGVSPPAFVVDPSPGVSTVASTAVVRSYFSELHRFFAGVQIGDYVFALPRVSYNFYGDYSSLGWGFTGGILAHPSQRFAIGGSIAYDRLRFDSKLDRFGPVALTSIQLNVLFNFAR